MTENNQSNMAVERTLRNNTVVEPSNKINHPQTKKETMLKRREGNSTDVRATY